MALPFNHPPTPLLASKDALQVQHEDPSHGAQAENEKSQYYSASTDTLCINFSPASFAAAFFASAFFVPTFFVPLLCTGLLCTGLLVQALHHIEANRAEAYPISCSARCLAILRVVVSTPNKAVRVRRLSSHLAYCRPNDSTLLSYRTLRLVSKYYIPKGTPLRNNESKCRSITLMTWLLRLLALESLRPL